MNRERFVCTPVSAITDKRISDGAYRLLGLIESYANRDGEAWPSRQSMASALGVSVRAVERRVAELVGAGVVVRVSRKRSNGSTTSNLYRLPERSSEDALALDLEGGASFLPPPSVISVAPVSPAETSGRGDIFVAGGASFLSPPELEPVELEVQPLAVADAPSAPKRQRQRNLLFDAIVEASNIVEPVPKTQASLIGKVAAELKAVDATPEDVHRRADAWCQRHPDIPVSPQILLHHWAALRPQPEASFDRVEPIEDYDAWALDQHELETSDA